MKQNSMANRNNPNTIMSGLTTLESRSHVAGTWVGGIRETDDRGSITEDGSELAFENQMDNFARNNNSRLTVATRQSKNNLDYLTNNIMANIKMRKSVTKKKAKGDLLSN